MESAKPTWYSLHKEQIKLIQWLLYHLNKAKREIPEQKSIIKIQSGEFIIRFD